VQFDEEKILEDFQAITLDEMKEVELMNRIDTKFVIGRSVFNEILPKLAQGYRSLEIGGTKLSGYSTQYFDTEKFDFFLDHHNGAGVRHKVRIRKYLESDILFLEIKKKVKGRTDKKRIPVTDFESVLSESSKEYIEQVIGEKIDLESKLYNSFRRITLVNKQDKERVTIDLGLGYTGENEDAIYDNVVIAELKQERVNRQSLFYRMMKANIIRPSGFSKYCIGAITLNPNLKYNNFKSKLLLIDKLS
jgi:hypothetical protein